MSETKVMLASKCIIIICKIAVYLIFNCSNKTNFCLVFMSVHFTGLPWKNSSVFNDINSQGLAWTTQWYNHQLPSVLLYGSELPSLKLRFSPLKMDGWKMNFLLFGKAYFQGRTVSFREGNSYSFPSLRNISFRRFTMSWWINVNYQFDSMCC